MLAAIQPRCYRTFYTARCRSVNKSYSAAAAAVTSTMGIRLAPAWNNANATIQRTNTASANAHSILIPPQRQTVQSRGEPAWGITRAAEGEPARGEAANDNTA